MNSECIYDDLQNSDLGLKVEKLKEWNEKLLSHIKTLESDVEKLCEELMKMKKNEDNLKKNISSLFNTSKVEIERKNLMIADLRKQLDDLLFKRRKLNEEQHVPLGDSNFNKRRHETSEINPYVFKKQKFDLDTTSIKSSALENHQNVKRGSESSKSYSTSPPRRERSRSRRRTRYRNRKRSRSKDRYCKESRNVSRERDRSRSRKNNRSSHDRNEKNDVFQGKDLREVLTNQKSKDSILKSSVSDKNCKTVIKEVLNRISDKHNRNKSSENISRDSKLNGEKLNSSKEIIETGKDVKKNYGKSFSNEHKSVVDNKDSYLQNLSVKKESERNENSKLCIRTHINSDNTKNSETDKLNNGSFSDFPCKIEQKSQIDIVNNCINNDTPDNISFLDRKADEANNSPQTESKIESLLKNDANGFQTKSTAKEDSVHEELEQNISNTSNSSRTSINSSRRRRCVIKMVN